jgi:hypothetical protein
MSGSIGSENNSTCWPVEWWVSFEDWRLPWRLILPAPRAEDQIRTPGRVENKTIIPLVLEALVCAPLPKGVAHQFAKTTVLRHFRDALAEL